MVRWSDEKTIDPSLFFYTSGKTTEDCYPVLVESLLVSQLKVRNWWGGKTQKREREKEREIQASVSYLDRPGEQFSWCDSPGQRLGLISVNLNLLCDILRKLNNTRTHAVPALPPLPPLAPRLDKGSIFCSYQWEVWVFCSPRVNPLQPQIDLLWIWAKKDNLHIHGKKKKTEKCWLNLMRVTLTWWLRSNVTIHDGERDTAANQMYEHEHFQSSKHSFFDHLLQSSPNLSSQS